MAFKKDKDKGQTEAEPYEVEGSEAEGSGDRPDNEPADDRGDASRAEDDPNRVANNGEVHDPGNSGLLGSDFTGSVEGQADKPNG